MSEVSESLHVFRATPSDARGLAHSRGVSLRIVASNERWTTVVTLEDDELELLADSVPGLNLHWSFFDDFGLTLTFCSQGEELGRLEWSWHTLPPEILPDQSPFLRAKSAELLVQLERQGAISSRSALDQLETAVRGGVLSSTELRNQVARAFGLPAYEWLSPAYCRATPLEETRRYFPDAEDVE